MKKTFALLLAFVLVITAAIGGTIAWLTDKTDEVKNTFTTSGIEIDLTETPNAKNDESEDIWQAKMIPGYEYAKDPKVEVKDATTEEIYLFVKFEVKNASNYVTYTSTLTETNGWTQGTGTGEGGNGLPTNVWYRTVKPADEIKSWYLLQGKGEGDLKNGYVAISEDLTKEVMATEGFQTPELIYTAYACQKYKNADTTFTAAEAWAKVNPTT